MEREKYVYRHSWPTLSGRLGSLMDRNEHSRPFRLEFGFVKKKKKKKELYIFFFLVSCHGGFVYPFLIWLFKKRKSETNEAVGVSL